MGRGVLQKKIKEGGEGKRDPSAEYREKEASASNNFTFLKLQISLSLLRVGPYFAPPGMELAIKWT